jgi:hypothetical protein
MSLFEEFTRKPMSVEEMVTRVKPAMERMKLEHPGVEFSFRPMVVVPGAEHQWVVADIDFTYYTFIGVRGEYSVSSIAQMMDVRRALGLRTQHGQLLYMIQQGTVDNY